MLTLSTPKDDALFLTIEIKYETLSKHNTTYDGNMTTRLDYQNRSLCHSSHAATGTVDNLFISLV